jgi:hypothetical protein
VDIIERPGSVTAPARPDGGAEGNTRLTSLVGMVLLVLFAAEGVTILSVRRLLVVHVVVGIVLIAPVLLKTATTGYRFVRYYRGSAPYVRKGPPHPVLRVLGPVVIASSLAVLGTGVALLAVTPATAGLLLFAHKASFVGWGAVMTVHVLGHLKEAIVSSWRDVRATALAGRARRLVLVASVLVVGVVVTVAVLPAATAWTTR